MALHNDITLQINLSPGDRHYAHLTIPALIAQHPLVNNRLLVVDCCRPQKTKLVDPDKRFPQPEFDRHVDEIVSLSERLLREGLVTRVVYLKPDDQLFDHLSKKYLNGTYKCSHGAGGMANMSYWAAIELPVTRYVMHYDADMLLYQKPGYQWYEDAVSLLHQETEAISAVPRLCPPLADCNIDRPSLNEGRPFLNATAEYWTNDWFSTRLFLVDKIRLSGHLPLVIGKLRLELLLRKLLRRAFPLDPEIILFKSLAASRSRCIILKSTKAWALHPANKGFLFLDLLPGLLRSITDGQTPSLQRGLEDVNMEVWKNHLKNVR